MIRMPQGWAVCTLISLLATTALAASPDRTTRRARLVASADSVKCTIRSIHGLPGPGGIDKRLHSLRKQLARPPFSSFKTLKLLQAVELEVPPQGTQETKLPTGKILKLSFKEKLLVRKDQIRLRMHLSITPPNSKRFLPGTLFTIANGGTLLVAGDKYNGGTHVVGVTCQSK